MSILEWMGVTALSALGVGALVLIWFNGYWTGQRDEVRRFVREASTPYSERDK